MARAAWEPLGRLPAAISITVGDGKVTAIELMAGRESLGQLDVELLAREGE